MFDSEKKTAATNPTNGIAYRNPIVEAVVEAAWGGTFAANRCGIFLDGNAVWAENRTLTEGMEMWDHSWTTRHAGTACGRVLLCTLEDGGPFVVLDLRRIPELD